MSHLHLPCRLALAVACVLASGCSMVRPEARPAVPSATPASGVARAAAAPAHAPLPVASSVAASPANWDPPTLRLDPETMVGQAWVFPSASPVLYGEDRFLFRRDRVEASNAREHVTGTWTVERDKLCVRLNASAWGSACYYVTSSPASGLQIRVLPDGERVPLKIQQESARIEPSRSKVDRSTPQE